ncbi:hypothetical protein BH09MYX1_BH09MYX1_00890 [soil metagenome]
MDQGGELVIPPAIGMTMFSPESFRATPQHGTRVTDEPSSLARWAAHPIVTADKAAGGGFALATFRDDVRRKANVEGVFGLGVDVDDGSLSVARAAEVFAAYWTIA